MVVAAFNTPVAAAADSDRDRLRRGVAEESAERREPKRELDDGRHRLAGVDVDQLTCSEHRSCGAKQFDDVAAGIDGAELKQARLVGALVPMIRPSRASRSRTGLSGRMPLVESSALP